MGKRGPGYRRIENWTTVAVTALPPGWRNVYVLDDGTVTSYACPAMLLQENRADSESWEIQTPTGPSRACRKIELEPPYDTRVVYAEDEDGWIDAANNTGNYAGTVGPTEDPNIFAMPAKSESPGARQ